ncbi:MAG: HlyD family secretion protein [Prolixibacteraceae bacterium]|jgi:HlyD family secretion protein|nr:HlyD family secretion protein [Prolixibacteraceae bacterium]
MENKQFFPPEIAMSSSESYFSENHSTGRVIYIAVILFLAATIALLPFVKIQVTTQCEGVVRSGYEDNPVVPVISGQVISCRIIENLSVKKGDTILLIASDKIDHDFTLLTFRLKEDSLQLSDLQKLILAKNSFLQTALYRQEYRSFSDRLAEQETQLNQAEREYLMSLTLFQKGITPRHEFEKVTNQYQFEKIRFQTIQAQQFALWQEKSKEITLEMADWKTKIEQLKKEKIQYCLIAPIGGTITGYSGIREGDFVVPNQPIARIAPDDKLLVECFISPSDIGLIEQGMDVSYQFHAFNYNLWGVATGWVNEISGNVVSVNNRPFFRVRCQLDQSFLKLKNGTIGNLKKGMTLTGRFKVADRTLFQLLYDKADNWLNPKLKNI